MALGGNLVACADNASEPGTTPGTEPTSDAQRYEAQRPAALIAYFSRPGENYYYGGRRDLKVGNTEVLAMMLAERIPADVYEIEAEEPYSADYDDTVQRNVREQESDARPAIAGSLPDLAAYDVVLLGSPIWNVRPPMIMHTFADGLDFTGKTVRPFTTYAMSGLGTTEREYAQACRGAGIGEGLAVQGEEVAEAGPAVGTWLRSVGLLRPSSDDVP